MKAEVKVAYQFIKAMHIALMTKGVGPDPMYFDFCLKTAFGKSIDCDYKSEDFIAFFIRQLGAVGLELRTKGGHVSWQEIPMAMLSPSLKDMVKVEAADYVIRQLTGRSRSSWVKEYEQAEQQRLNAFPVAMTAQPGVQL